MPAAAVIPAPLAYIKVVAVKTLVVGLKRGPLAFASTGVPVVLIRCRVDSAHYLEKIRVFKAGASRNKLAWNNKI